MNTSIYLRCHTLPSQTRGLSLIELMIGMVLGLLVIAGVISIFISTQQANRVTEGLSRAQETQRLAFDLMARSIREAGGNFCGRNLPIATNIPAPPWWQDASTQLRGFDNAGMALPAPPNGPVATPAPDSRIAGTDAIQITSASLGEPYTIVNTLPLPAPPAPPAPPIGININRAPVGNDFTVGGLAVACDYTLLSVFPVTALAGSLVSFNPGVAPNLVIPGNNNHSFMRAAAPVSGTFVPATLTTFHAETWYIGNNGRGANPVGRSLYRQRLNNAGALVTEEILENVTDMQITYSRFGNQAFANAAPGWTQANWNSVIAVRIDLTIETPIGASERADVAATLDINEHLTARRALTQTIVIRSRAE